MSPAIPIAITGGEVYTPAEQYSPGLVVIEQAKISYAGPLRPELIPAGAQVWDATGQIVAPGFVDSHIHGCGGADCLRDGAVGIRQMAQFLARRGVTAFLPTTPSAPLAQLEEAVRAVREVMAQPTEGAQVLGLHLEGPYLASARKGAHVAAHLRNPSIGELAHLVELGQGAIKLVTLAPELPGALAAIEWLSQHGIVASLGHSNASYQQAQAAIAAGATRGCHLFNAMPELSKREPGLVGALLEDERVFAEFIADLHHLHPVMLKMALLLKGLRHSILISDAIEAAGRPDGQYDLGGLEIAVKDGVARLADGTLAGSTLTLDRAVRNVVQELKLPLAEALIMASRTPADSLGLLSKGRLQPGADADLVILKGDLFVAMTVVGGEVVYQGA